MITRLRPALLVSLLILAPQLGCVEPADRRPGLWLSGDLAKGPVADWAFTADHREIMIETQTPYWVPHSVTILCASMGGRLYVAAREPAGKRWLDHVDRDPDVRLKIGDRLFEQRLALIEGAAAREAVYAAYVSKYGWTPIAPEWRPEFRFFEVVERGTD